LSNKEEVKKPLPTTPQPTPTEQPSDEDHYVYESIIAEIGY